MPQSFLSRAVLIFLSTTLAVLTVACGRDKQITITKIDEQPVALTDKSAASPIDASVPSVKSARLSSETDSNYFEQGLDKAISAFSISQSAQSTEDWNLVANQFIEAIALMNKVSVNSPYYPNAHSKILEYQRQIRLAQRKVAPPVYIQPRIEPKKIVTTVPKAYLRPKVAREQQTIVCESIRALNSHQCSHITLTEKQPQISSVLPTPEQFNQQQEVVSVPIKRRVGGTPIIEVTFNGNRHFEMILDTGASGTVITQNMAAELGVVAVGRAQANTASSKSVEFPIGYINSMEVGKVIVHKVAVAIAGEELETGLLGHDFFGNYDLTIKRNVVEFRPQATSQTNSTKIPISMPEGHRYVEFP
ncbi:MAG: retropepsin-like aspartic protease [Rhizonema sp. NSF051]|nr:retropepsin-like aspartic protease [Rhizonema sp. NSF051]